MKNILKVTITFLVLTIMIASVSFATGLNTIEMEEDQKEILNLMKDPIDNDVLDKMNTINSDVFISEENISVEEHVKMYEDKGMSRKDAMKAAAKDRGLTKRDIYAVLNRED